MFKDKKIILGITGSIAAYKSCLLVRKLREKGAQIRVVMTESACQFVTPLTFKTLSGNPVYLRMFDELPKNGIAYLHEQELVHIRLSQWADAMVVAPATANIISKTACGIADDLLSTLLVSFQGPIIFAPAMDDGMYRNKIFNENLNKLKDKGYHVLSPEKGVLASGKVGKGRFPKIENIMEHISGVLSARAVRQAGGEDFKGIKILITAGGTREFMDPIRFIGNASSGKMGYALAEAAQKRGAHVKLISAPTLLPRPNGVKIINIVTANQMKGAVIKNFASADVLIMSAAVGDFRPKTFVKQKRKRSQGKWNVELIPNSDILAQVAKFKKNKITVGFSVETHGQIKKAKEKLKKKGLDLIVANDVSSEKSGFCSDTNKAALIDKNGEIERLPLIPKRELANIILDKIQNIGREKWERKN